MALYTGLTGYVKKGSGVDASVIAHISGFELEKSAEILEDVSFGNDYKEKVPTIKDWSASANGSVDFDSTSGQEDLDDAFEDGTKLTFAFGIKPVATLSTYPLFAMSASALGVAICALPEAPRRIRRCAVGVVADTMGASRKSSTEIFAEA